MTTATDAVKAAYQKLLGRDKIGQTGQTYWEKQWNTVYQNAKNNQGLSEADAVAAATANIETDIGASAEAKGYAKYGIAKTAIEGYAGSGYETIDETADWYETNFTADDPNEYAEGRDVNWASKLSTSNLENYLDTLNYQYGQLQGNTVGQEGSEWWGYQKTGAIDYYMSDEGGNYSFATASKMADAGIAQDIAQSTSAANYKKFGTVGYGNPLEIKTGVDDDGDAITEKKWLNLDPATNLNPTGTKASIVYQTDEDGELVLDGDGNPIPTGETGTPYSWQYVPDATAPGGYRITPVPYDTGGGTSTAGHDHYMANYQLDGAFVGGGGPNPFTIPTGVENVDASQFTLPANDPNKLTLAQWAETKAGKSSIAADDYSIKNKWFIDTNKDGILESSEDTSDVIDHSTTDSNLGLGEGETYEVDWGDGHKTFLSGGPKDSSYVPTPPSGAGVAGAGNTIIQLDQNQKSTTAANRALKIEDRAIASGQGRKGFSTAKYKPTGNIRTLGIVS